MIKLVGLSLSLCVKDVITESAWRVEQERVSFLITATKAENEEQWDSVLRQYAASHWRVDPQQALAFARRLWREGRIVQPRVEGELPPAHTSGHWIPEHWNWHIL